MAGRPPKLTPAEQMRLVNKYTTGTPLRELGVEFHLSKRTVRQYIHGRHKSRTLQFPGDKHETATL